MSRWSLLALLLLCKAALCAEPNYPIITMQHTAWSARDGVPGVVRSMAQTPDGWLWLASARGLYRFDGVSFEKYDNPHQPLLSSKVFAVGTLPSGALWIGYDFGGISFLRDGKVTSYAARDGLPHASVRAVVQEADGGIWAGTAMGLYYRAPRDSAWRPYTDGVAEKTGVASLLLDDQGTLWLRTVDATLARARGETRFHRVADGGSFGQLVQGPDGSVWMTDLDKAGLQMLRAPAHRPAPRMPPLPASVYLAFDHQGNAWTSTSKDDVLLKIAPTEQADRITRIDETQGLTGTPNALLVDMEGNVWVGTGKGLDRFRPNRLESIDVPDYLADGRPIAPGPDGSLRVDRYVLDHPGQPDQKTVRTGPAPTAQNLVTAIYSDPDGSYWMGASDALTHVVNGKAITVELPEAVRKPSTVFSLMKDHQGGLWMIRRRVYRYLNGVWTVYGGVPALQPLLATSMLCDAQGRMWFGTVDNQLAVWDGARLKIFKAADGLRVGAISHITEHDGMIWLGGENGVATFDGKRFTSIAGKDNDSFAGASGLLFDAKGTLWINGLDGISGIAADALAKARNDSGYKAPFVRYDFLDGLRGTPAQTAQAPSAVMGTDGRMWFSTSFGVYNLQPDRMPRNPLRPAVTIRALRSGERKFEVAAAHALPAGTTSLQISYTALSLTMSERVQFKYRLDGVDEGWQDAGTRRTAYYTGLAPGRYRFRVIACNNDGLWNEQGDSMEISIAPAFYQTIWFKVLCAAATLVLFWLAYRWRLALVTRRVQERYNERLQERERIARALHDTLLQGVQILTMRFQLAMDRTPPDRQTMESALDAADRVIVDARDQVQNLRTAPGAVDMFNARLHAVVDSLVETLPQHGRVECIVSIAGTPREVDGVVQDELCAIAYQALINALQHAAASRIEIALEYGASTLSLRVSDNGKGIAADTLRAGQRDGHWGLPGMRERAAGMKARFDIHSGPDAGTAISVRLRGRTAYRKRNTSWVRKAIVKAGMAIRSLC